MDVDDEDDVEARRVCLESEDPARDIALDDGAAAAAAAAVSSFAVPPGLGSAGIETSMSPANVSMSCWCVCVAKRRSVSRVGSTVGKWPDTGCGKRV